LTSQRTRISEFGVTAFFGVMVLAIVVIVFNSGFTFRSLLLILIATILLVPLGIRRATARLDLFEPIVLGNIALAVMFVVRPLSDLTTGNTTYLGYDFGPTFDEALLVALLGIIFFQLGYFLQLGRRWAPALPAPPPFHATRAARAGWAYLLIGGLLFGTFLRHTENLGLLFFLLEGRSPSDNALFLSSTGYLYKGLLMWAASALIFLLLALATKRKSYWIWFAIPTVCLLIFYGARGTRSLMLPLALAIPTVVYLRARRRPRIRTLFIVGVVAVAMLGWLREIRETRPDRDLAGTFIAAVSSPVREAADIASGADASMFDSLAIVLSIVPEQVPFQHGATASDLITRAIPRPIWPSKPLESSDALVNWLWPKHYLMSRASAAFSLIGVFYADSGVVSVALGMFLIGVALSISWHWFEIYSSEPLAQIIYSMGLPFVVILLRGSIPNTLANMLFMLIPLVLLIWLVRIRVRSPSVFLTKTNRDKGASKV
jgi:hypothetical protein